MFQTSLLHVKGCHVIMLLSSTAVVLDRAEFFRRTSRGRKSIYMAVQGTINVKTACHNTGICHARMQAETWKAIAHIPWMIKPLYGFVTDTFPINGLRRQPYIIICGLTGGISPSIKLLLNFSKQPKPLCAATIQQFVLIRLAILVNLFWQQGLCT